MSLRAGAETVVDTCLGVEAGEHVVVVDDGVEEALVDALLAVLEERNVTFDYHEYPEPETHGAEPPETVAEALREADVFIAPTRKSLSHTRARREATAAGARGATMPGITRAIWESSLLADYEDVAARTGAVAELLRGSSRVHVETPRGTDLTCEVREAYLKEDTGLIHGPGAFGNLPAGEAFFAPMAAAGTVVADGGPFAAAGTTVEVEDNAAVGVDGEDGPLVEAFDDVDGARRVAEFGVGTNPAASVIGNVLQDEKVLGTVHVAFGDNSSMVPASDPHAVDCPVHYDLVLEEPTVRFDDTVVIEAGEPRFRP